MADFTNLKIGSFYWVQIAFDPDTNLEWENQEMPARYEGNGLWIFLNQEGVSNWPVKWVGDEIKAKS